ncbi:MAG: MBL fold metallo-hydrolase [Actinomycetota bacterium]|nr:MBL fold metallo-hydrolase [Actinomycetota bacterium]
MTSNQHGSLHQPAVLSFLGAAGTVTGSRFLLEARGSRLLVDCGLFQGLRELRQRNWSPFPVDPATIDAVVLTHAHLDHCGYLPALVRDGFAGPIVSTRWTAELARIVLQDSAHLQEEEASYANAKGFSKHRPALPLYTGEDAAAVFERFRPVDYHAPLQVADGLVVELVSAGHIVGSASALVTIDGAAPSRVFFSGDVGRPHHPILRPPQTPPAADVFLVESTYGNRLHEPEERALDRMADAITRTARRGGTVVIPSFAVDRTEVLLIALGKLVAQGKVPKLPIYADSPMALAVLDVYRAAIAAHAADVALADGTDPFELSGELHELRTPDESRSLNELGYPSIIISASGMATGGRVLHHLARCLPDSRCSVILAGFQSEGTRGRQLADGARTVKLLGKYVPVRAEVLELSAFSVHADAAELTEWLRPVPVPDTGYLVHGEVSAANAMASRLADELGWNAVVPTQGERVRVER